MSRLAGEITVSVVDHGDGLDERDSSRIIERFARAAPAGSGRRFGLGLALVNEVVRAHGGRLDITGRVGEGSRFTLRLPVFAHRRRL